MDEPASALDPVATLAIEDLVGVLKNDYTIVIVTHNMQQAARVADMTAFFSVDADEKTGNRSGVLVESGPTSDLFIRPQIPAPRRTSPADSASRFCPLLEREVLGCVGELPQLA